MVLVDGCCGRLKGQLRSLREQYRGHDSADACNRVIEAFRDYGDDARARAVEISHAFRREREAKQRK